MIKSIIDIMSEHPELNAVETYNLSKKEGRSEPQTVAATVHAIQNLKGLDPDFLDEIKKAEETLNPGFPSIGNRRGSIG